MLSTELLAHTRCSRTRGAACVRAGLLARSYRRGGWNCWHGVRGCWRGKRSCWRGTCSWSAELLIAGTPSLLIPTSYSCLVVHYIFPTLLHSSYMRLVVLRSTRGFVSARVSRLLLAFRQLLFALY